MGLFSRNLPIDDGEHGNHHDERADATCEDGDADGHPERTLGDDHRHHANGRSGGGEEAARFTTSLYD